MSGKKSIEYIVIELNVLRNDYIRHDATFMEKVTAKNQEEAVQIVRDLNEFTIDLGDLIAVPRSQFKMYSRYTDEVKVWEDD